MTAETGNGSRNDEVQPWTRHKLLRELAMAERTAAEIGRDYGMTAGAVRKFKHDHKAEIGVIAASLADEFSGLWIADKGQRIAAAQHDYELSLASGEYAGHYEHIRTRTQIRSAVAEELGQLPPRTTVTVIPVVHQVVGVDLDALT